MENAFSLTGFRWCYLEKESKKAPLFHIHSLQRSHCCSRFAYTREILQATVEELQASNKKLRSTNEEMQSTNEELQSTNEELETSREELQSVTEELRRIACSLD